MQGRSFRGSLLLSERVWCIRWEVVHASVRVTVQVFLSVWVWERVVCIMCGCNHVRVCVCDVVCHVWMCAMQVLVATTAHTHIALLCKYHYTSFHTRPRTIFCNIHQHIWHDFHSNRWYLQHIPWLTSHHNNTIHQSIFSTSNKIK